MKHTLSASDREFLDAYAAAHIDCEIWPKLPWNVRGKGLTPGFNPDDFYQDATETHHLHRGCHRIHEPWNVVRVCHWVHDWAHVNHDNEQCVRVLAIRDKIRRGEWDGGAAFIATGVDMIGQLCGWVIPKRLEWVHGEWYLLTKRHKARKRR